MVSLLSFHAVFVEVFRRNVDVALIPFECVGNGERLEQIQVMQGLEYGITLYQGQKVEDAFLPVIEQQEQLVPVNVFCTDNFFPHYIHILFQGFDFVRVFTFGGLLPGFFNFFAVQVKPFQNEAQSPFRDFALHLAVFNFDGNLVVLIGGMEMRRVVVDEP
jgi:hypothetical protein